MKIRKKYIKKSIIKKNNNFTFKINKISTNKKDVKIKILLKLSTIIIIKKLLS